MKLLKLAVVAALASLVAGCSSNTSVSINGATKVSGGIKGSGTATKEKRDLDSFNRISVQSHIVANISQGTEYSATVDADDNIVPLVKTEKVADTLEISIDGDTEPELPVTVNVTLPLPDITQFHAEGIAKIVVDGSRFNELEVGLRGTAQCKLSGAAERLEINMQGHSKVDAAGFKAHEIYANADDNSSATLHPINSLDVTANGMSRIYYTGNWVKLNKKVSNTARVEQRGGSSTSIKRSTEKSRRDKRSTRSIK